MTPQNCVGSGKKLRNNVEQDLKGIMTLPQTLFKPPFNAVVAAMFLLSLGPLVTALISQYGFGLHPCVLCIYQRVPYVVAIVLSVIAVIVARKKPKWLAYVLLLYGLAYLVGAGIAGFHVGVELKWWEGTDSCGSDGSASSIEELRKQILSAPTARCDEASFVFLGLSFAGWNMVFSLATALGVFAVARAWITRKIGV